MTKYLRNYALAHKMLSDYAPCHGFKGNLFYSWSPINSMMYKREMFEANVINKKIYVTGGFASFLIKMKFLISQV